MSERLRAFFEAVPHNRALGLALLPIEGDRARIRLPYRADLVGHPDTGVLHGGAITALLDACCGAAVMIKLPAAGRLATLDLRIDYLGPARPPHDVIAEAECYKATRHIAFVRSMAYHHDPDDPIAAAVGTFMIARPELAPRAADRGQP